MSLSRIFVSLLFISAAACTSEIESSGGNGDNTGNGDGSGGGNGDGSGGGNGDGNDDSETCSLSSLVNAEQEGFYFSDSEGSGVLATIGIESGMDFESLDISIDKIGAITTLGPGSYTLSKEASLAECNPCVEAVRGTGGGDDFEMLALATEGVLRIDTLDPKVGGTFAGAITGLKVAEFDDGGSPSCSLSIPDLNFSVTMVEPMM